MSLPNPQSPCLSLSLLDFSSLHLAFMPFIDGGGLFVATSEQLPMGTDIMLQLKLMDDPALYHVSGRVIWLTPLHAQDGRTPGVGMQFDAVTSAKLLPIIQAYLAHIAPSSLPTHTM